MPHISYLEAIVVGLLQGVSELFPVSSLGHSVLLPALVGGQWAKDLSMAGADSPYLAVLVAMHVATAIALVVFFWSDWLRIIGGLFTAIRDRKIETTDQRLAVLLVIATIPVGIAGLLLEKTLRNYLGLPIPSAIFLALNGVVLYAVERLRSRKPAEASPVSNAEQTIDFSRAFSNERTMPIATVENDSDARLAKLSVKDATLIGASQILALLPGISRSGITMTTGLLKGLKHEDAARFAFLLATPVILAAGVLKIPSLFTPSALPSLGPAIVGSVVAGVAAYVSVRFLVSYFETRTLNPFAIYCVVAGVGSLTWLTLA